MLLQSENDILDLFDCLSYWYDLDPQDHCHVAVWYTTRTSNTCSTQNPE